MLPTAVKVPLKLGPAKTGLVMCMWQADVWKLKRSQALTRGGVENMPTVWFRGLLGLFGLWFVDVCWISKPWGHVEASK